MYCPISSFNVTSERVTTKKGGQHFGCKLAIFVSNSIKNNVYVCPREGHYLKVIPICALLYY